MVKAHQPRSGSMQFWPRKRAKRETPRVRAWASSDDAKFLGFVGYKVGMTHLIGTDNRKTSTKKGLDIPYPVTIIECPPLKIASVRFYKDKQAKTEFFVGTDKNLFRRLTKSKSKESELNKINVDDYDDLTILIHTQPSLTTISKKKPDVFEMHLGGNLNEKFNFVKDKLNKEIKVSEIFEAGEIVDTHSITTGRGYSGPVKRFGIGLKSHKSEKGRRRPGSLGGWKGQQHFMYRVPMAGQMGYQQRTQYNIQILKVDDKPEDINARGGFIHYGIVKNDYILVKGSVPGPKKRLIVLTKSIRPGVKNELPTIQYVSKSSQQGR